MHPEWSRSCRDCAQWSYRDDGTIDQRGGKPQPRPPRTPLPCFKCPKIPAGEEPCRDNAVELTERNLQAYLHHMECRAVGEFPNDPIVRRNARILRAILDEVEQRPLHKLIAMLGMRNV